MGCLSDNDWVPWWTEKDADLKYGDLSGPHSTDLGGGLPMGITTRFNEDGKFNPDDFHWHPESNPFSESVRRSIEKRGTVAVACFPLLTVTLHKWLTGFNTKTPEETLRAAAAAAAANHKPPRPSQSQSQWPGPSLATSPEHTPARRPSANDLRGPSGSFQKERNIRRVLYLVTGFGDPVEESHSPEANSTAATARLMKRFINACHPHVEVKLVDSGAGVFRYDENVRFLQTNLRPALERERDSVARRWGEEWPRRFKLTMALCGGAPARLQALTAAFRDMQPYLLHVWRLKTFWHQGLLRKDDVDMQKWERAEGAPPTRSTPDALQSFFAPGGLSSHERKDSDEDASLVTEMVQEMKRHRDVFLSMSHGKHELGEFWLRKTQKPVLAVLCVRRRKDTADDDEKNTDEKNTKPQYFRGVNLEVSMPTGSLCSERNAIGNALASDPALRRKDLFGIAVLSLGKGDIGAHVGTGGAMSRESSFVNLAQLAGVHGGVNGGGESTQVDAQLCRPVRPGLVSRGDLNPLKPCGACKEWLLKIAEVNPGFKVLMFGDVSCDEVYIKNVSQC